MAESAAWALQQAIYDTLINNVELTQLLGGPYVYDHVPRDHIQPYLSFGVSTIRDWSTGDGGGHEHLLTLHAWSRSGGMQEVSRILSSVRGALHDAALVLTDHNLINFRHTVSDIRREADGNIRHGITRFRAVTEPI